MEQISGAITNIGFKRTGTWGTAVAAGAGNKLGFELTPDFGVEELVARQIGSGVFMATNAERGNYIPTFSVVGDAGFRNNMDVMMALLMGTAAAPSEQTGGQGDYLHTLTFNSTLNAGGYGTLAYESSSTTTIESSSVAVTQFGIKTTKVPGYLEFSASLLGKDISLSSSTNTNATLQASTYTETVPELIVADLSDTSQINANSGAGLSGSDQYNITGFDLTLSRPQQITPEIKGAAGNSAPDASGLFEATFNITVKALADHTFFTVWNNQTAQKAKLSFQGTQIGSGTNKALNIFLPKIVLVNEPKYSVTNPGTNPLSMSFRALKASANPTGMTSTYPYFTIVNTLATSLVA